MFPLKGILLLTASAVLMPRAFAMPGCGVCANPAAALRSMALKSASAPTALGEKKILYIRLNYPDDSGEPITSAAAEELMTEVASFYRKHSYGKCWTAATVTPLITLPSPKATYFPVDQSGQMSWLSFRILADAREAARRAGYDPAEYDFDMLRFNSPFVQSWANIGLPGAWMVTSHPATTIHELGHNLGLNHANAWNGSLTGTGSNTEYGDRFDVMGNPHYHEAAGFNTVRKSALGWLDEGNVKHVTASGVHRLYAQDTEAPMPGKTYCLRIRKDDERDYWIEKRQKMEFPYDMESSGVLAYWDEWSESNGGTHLLDPLEAPGWALPIAEPLIDAAANVRVFPLRQSEDRSYVDVAVILGNAALNILPGVLHFAGEGDQAYTLESSTDLASWSRLEEASTPHGEIFIPIETESQSRFYRVR